MLYLPELYYFFDSKDFPTEKAITVTAITVAKWSQYYRAELIEPKKGISNTVRTGKLPDNKSQIETFIKKLLLWIFDSSTIRVDLFSLFLDSYPLEDKWENTNRDVAKFDHHDDTCCWVLNLTKTEFEKLQQVWKDNNLPTDLFYPEGKGITVKDTKGILKKFLSYLGFRKIYTPKQWEIESLNL